MKFFLLFSAFFILPTNAQYLIPSQSWIPSTLEEATILSGKATLNHTLPLTPKEVQRITDTLLSYKTLLPISLQGQLFFATAKNGFISSLTLQPYSPLIPKIMSNDSAWKATIGGTLTGEIVARSTQKNPYLTRYEERHPLVTLDFSGTYNDNFIFSTYSVWRNLWPVYIYDVNDSNIPKKLLRDLDVRNFHKAYIFYDFGFLSAQVGRDNFRWGVGERGTLMLSDNVPYYDMIRIGMYGKNWKAISAFTTLTDYEPQFYGPGKYKPVEEIFKPPKTMFAHRVEFLPWEKLNIGLSEMTIIFGRYPTLSDINPLIIQHNLYKEYQNSLASFDFTLYPYSGISLYGELTLDEVNIGKSGTDTERPTSLGYQLGTKIVHYPFVGVAEYIFLDKWLYNYPKEYNPIGRPLEMDGVQYVPSPGRDLILRPMGHWLQPDSRSLYFAVQTSSALSYKAKISYEQRNYGEVTLDTPYLDSIYINQNTPTGIVEATNIYTINGGYHYWNLYVEGKISLFTIKNFLHKKEHNISGAEYQFFINIYF